MSPMIAWKLIPRPTPAWSACIQVKAARQPSRTPSQLPFGILLPIAQLPSKSTKMKKLYALLLLCSIAGLQVQAQVSSTQCLDEARAVYAHIDHQALLSGAVQMHFSYTHSYIMRLDEEGKTVVMPETKTIGPGFYLHDCSEFTDASDAQEAISHRKYQMLVYRTKPNLPKAAIIPDVDSGIFATCLVSQCGYIPAPKNDTLRYKRAFMTLSDGGQQRYKVRDMEWVWNPWTQVPVSVTINFTERSMWRWAQFDFHTIAPQPVPVETSIKNMLQDPSGQLKGPFIGMEILDYR